MSPRLALSTAPRARQQGAAALIVVMILFFVISMTAAYTNRNLIFEQKTSANQQRSTRALEAAEAGLQWALTMLNGGRLTAACATSTSVADTSFRERYLVIDSATGTIVPRKRSDGVTDLHPTCVYDGTSWTCDCPSDAAPSLTAPSGNDIHPAFRLRFRRMCGTNLNAADTACVTPDQASVINIDVNACTTMSETCLAFPATALSGEGRVTVHAALALAGGLPVAPTAALTAKGNIDVGGGLVNVSNSDVSGTGVTVLAGGTVNGNLQPTSKAGSPGSQSIVASEPELFALAAAPDRMFANTFGMWRATFRDQPAALRIDCSVSCSAATLRSKIALNPGRPIWVIGDLDFDSSGDVGSAAAPVLVNVTGNITFTTPINFYGLLYSQAADWAANGSGTVTGAVIAEGNLTGKPASAITRDSTVLSRLRAATGSFVLVPGTWKDFDQ